METMFKVMSDQTIFLTYTQLITIQCNYPHFLFRKSNENKIPANPTVAFPLSASIPLIHQRAHQRLSFLHFINIILDSPVNVEVSTIHNITSCIFEEKKRTGDW